MGRPEKIRLGDLLVGQKIVSQENLRLALEQQKRSGRKLGRVLVELGFVTEDQICEAIARQLNIPFVNLKFFNTSQEVVRRLPEAQARRFRSIVLEDRAGKYVVGMSDPTDLFAFDELSRILKREIQTAVVNESLLLQTIDRVYRRTEEISGLAKELEREMGDYIDFGALGAGLGAEDAPVVKLLQSMFEDAAQVNASDVHIEPQETNVQIRFRIDGVLLPQTEIDTRTGPAMVIRLKLMAGLDISEKRLPQDGRFAVMVRELPVDVRMSTMPTQYGESVVLRLLNKRTGLLGLDHIGMPADMLARFRRVVRRMNAMVLVTGPTGSGKTTTLYAALAELNTIDKKIITVEDPVEYRLRGINQVQVNEKIELTFARVLRSALRQDPDIILVGEMRDEETAQIGLRAALTGHLVLSTLHTKDAISTPIRLIDMGAPHYMVATSVHAVLAQRLLRLVCESCAEPYKPEGIEARWLASVESGEGPAPRYMHGRGCSNCNGTGFQGRTGVYELLEMTPELVRAANRNDPMQFIETARRQLEGQTLGSNAFRLAMQGRTTVEEAIRVASSEEE
ncbi:MAG TPA: GspE/PulE family protein [Burkholderiales bacterium]|jgi:MSHA biogenesis protein MshE|nr:GspE/PulE family protein [Burkholderiales bacterium]HTL25220.1 GspE/PulE family protein [Burkholderiales bacterium]